MDARSFYIALSAFVLVVLDFSPLPALAEGGDNSAKIELCGACHGKEGRPVVPQTPIIWGQEYYYLYVQLKDYKAGRRANDVMQGIVADLDKEDMRALAKYFSEKNWPNSGYATADSYIAPARSALSSGQCVQCHLGGYEGNSRIPRLAGQNVDYLEATMLNFKNGVRQNSPAKISLLEAYEESDIKAMAEYLAGL